MSCWLRGGSNLIHRKWNHFQDASLTTGAMHPPASWQARRFVGKSSGSQGRLLTSGKGPAGDLRQKQPSLLENCLWPAIPPASCPALVVKRPAAWRVGACPVTSRGLNGDALGIRYSWGANARSRSSSQRHRGYVGVKPQTSGLEAGCQRLLSKDDGLFKSTVQLSTTWYPVWNHLRRPGLQAKKAAWSAPCHRKENQHLINLPFLRLRMLSEGIFISSVSFYRDLLPASTALPRESFLP